MIVFFVTKQGMMTDSLFGIFAEYSDAIGSIKELAKMADLKLVDVSGVEKQGLSPTELEKIIPSEIEFWSEMWILQRDGKEIHDDLCCQFTIEIKKIFNRQMYKNEVKSDLPLYPPSPTSAPVPPTGGDGQKSRVLDNVLPPNIITEDMLALLKNEVSWDEMSHAGGVVSRLVSVQGTIIDNIEPIYRFPTDFEFHMHSWTPTMKKIRDFLSEFVGFDLNHGKIQYYADGESWIGHHADKTLDITKGSSIVNISFGETRTMVLKHKTLKNEKGEYIRQEFPLKANSLFILDWETNKDWTHSIKKVPKDSVGPRISIVYRSISTFKRPDGKLYGQGARAKTEAEIEKLPDIDIDDDTLRLFRAFGKENNLTNYLWEEVYGTGFDSLDLGRLPK